jgi:hypothetical protein
MTASAYLDEISSAAARLACGVRMLQLPFLVVAAPPLRSLSASINPLSGVLN